MARTPNRDGAAIDPRRPHRYRETNDPGIIALADGGDSERAYQMVAAGVVSASLRAMACAVPGCGKDRNDDIHAVPEA